MSSPFSFLAFFLLAKHLTKITNLVPKPYALRNEIVVFSLWFRDQIG